MYVESYDIHICYDFHFRFVCIYPQYINSKKTRQEGRKIKKENCVENPTYQELRDVLALTNLNMYVENKIYPRERSKVSSTNMRYRQLDVEIFMIYNQLLIILGTYATRTHSFAVEE